MHALLESLVEDHRHMLRLINCLNFQGYLLAEQDCDDYFILMEILDYLPIYLDQYHHPVEDCLYSILQENNVLKPEIIWRTQTEHIELVNLGKYLNKVFKDLTNNEKLPRKYFQYIFGHYAQRQFDHMKLEEEILFLSIEKYFTHMDWVKIEKQVDELLQLAFDRNDHLDYEDIHNKIDQSVRRATVH